MENQTISIGKKKIGRGNPIFIIAEAGVNHNGKTAFAKRLIDVAAKAGADAIKFQTFNPDTLVTKSAKKAKYQISSRYPSSGRRGGETQYAMLKRLMLPRGIHAKLKRYTEKKGLIFLSTPFSESDALFLRKLGVPALKIASSDANNLPLLSTLAKWKLPIILSTGMTDMREVREAAQTVKMAGNAKLILLHCTTNYPTPFSEANLLAIETLRREFNLPVGFSDHTRGSEAAIAAVALGASVIEKHFTLDRNLPGPDHKASLLPDELCDFVTKIRHIETALGTGEKIPSASERKNAEVSRKSIVAARDIRRGERLTSDNLAIKRPGTGLLPRELNKIVDSRATHDIVADTLITKYDFAP